MPAKSPGWNTVWIAGKVVAKGKACQEVLVHFVEPRSPASKAGLRKGDVILTVGERSVSNRFDVERALWGCKAGDKIEVAFLREGKVTAVSMALSQFVPAHEPLTLSPTTGGH